MEIKAVCADRGRGLLQFGEKIIDKFLIFFHTLALSFFLSISLELGQTIVVHP
jgi:hypothetical protein